MRVGHLNFCRAVAFFKKDSRGYQTRLNAALRQVMYDSLAR